MTIPPFVNVLAFVAVAITLLFLCVTSTRKFLFACGFIIPFITPNLIFGINVFWFNIISMFALLTLPIAKTTASVVPNLRPFGLFLGYTIVITLAWMIPEYLVMKRYLLMETIGLGVGQTIYKMPVQLAGFSFQLLAIYVIPTRARNHAEVMAGFSGYIWGLLITVLIGVAMFLSTGAAYVRETANVGIDIEGINLVRLGGFSGEPKHLGSFLVVGLGFLLAMVLFHEVRGFPHRKLKWTLGLAAALLVTYSTSAWIAFVVMLAAQVLLSRRSRRQKLLVAAIALAAVVLFEVPFLRAIIDERFVARVLSEETQEIEGSGDNYVIDVYTDKPEYLPIGFGMGGTDLESVVYLLKGTKYEKQWQYIRTPTPSTNGLRILGDLGLIGLGLFVFALFSWGRRLRNSGLVGLATFVLATGIGIMFQSLNSFTPFLFLVGGAMSWESITRRSKEAPS